MALTSTVCETNVPETSVKKFIKTSYRREQDVRNPQIEVFSTCPQFRIERPTTSSGALLRLRWSEVLYSGVVSAA